MVLYRILEGLVESLEILKLNLPTKRDTNTFPVENSWIVIKFLQDLNFRERPRVHLLNGLIDPHNHIRQKLLVEIEVLSDRGNGLSETVRMGLHELPQFPVILLFYRVAHHQ